MRSLLLGFWFVMFLSCSTDESKETKLTEEEIWIINEGWIAENNANYFIQFPEDWVIEKNEFDNDIGFRIISPKTSENDSVFENIVLYRQFVKPGTRVDYFGARSVNNNQFQYNRDYVLHSRELIKEDSQYYRIDATLNTEGQNIRGIQYMILRERSMFILSLYCTTETFNQYQEIGEKIMKSFIPKENFWIKNPEPYI